MKHSLVLLALAAALCGPLAARAELPVGAPAPDFSAPASLGGNEFTFKLEQALAQGPVVLYFYPAAFTQGCTIEARNFAEATDDYKALGATVIGVSADDIQTLKKFSVSECRSKFAVAADGDQAIMKAYDAVHDRRPDYAKRVSYVITPDRKILYAYTDMSPDRHVANTLKALREWRASQPRAAK
ncbi:peroxiredoxin [Bordetella petrii]|uniref:peroxiredoxin n=1 Tax=Bordetella petrii TaxID=94624 RepID=UPI001E5574C8|nr:peroxiredoxin [Bordetella petrii]MCD0502398.1 peroxiredoxin [Bordetella petrii]